MDAPKTITVDEMPNSNHQATSHPADAYGIVERQSRWGESDAPFARDAFEAARYIDDLWRLLRDPNAVHINLLAGKIGKPSLTQILHLYPGLETALRAIIARADTDKPGTSKVQDMRYIAEKALEGSR